MIDTNCACKYSGLDGITLCPLHAAAPDLLAACQAALDMLRRIQLDMEGAGSIPWVEADNLDLAIAKATKVQP